VTGPNALVVLSKFPTELGRRRVLERGFDVSPQASNGCLGIGPIGAGACTINDVRGISAHDVFHRLAETGWPCGSDPLLSLGRCGA
jgi:hypothetical protein